MTRLLDVPVGARVRLAPINSASLEGRLRAIGLYPGDYIRVLRLAPFGGPLLIEAHERQIALGRQIAGSIRVEGVSCVSR